MRRLLVATTNRHKLREIGDILHDLPLSIETLADHPGIGEAEERGATFRDNARAKALYYSAATGLPTVAEDSGLEIAALGGAPGVGSARYNGATYEEKFAALYRDLERRGARPSTGSGRPELVDGSTALTIDPERVERVEGRASEARFVCALAYARDGAVVFETEGVVEGRIASEPRGANGFGYDPIFFYPPYGRTLAQVSAAEKLSVSHRGRAFRAFREYLRSAAL